MLSGRSSRPIGWLGLLLGPGGNFLLQIQETFDGWPKFKLNMGLEELVKSRTRHESYSLTRRIEYGPNLVLFFFFF